MLYNFTFLHPCIGGTDRAKMHIYGKYGVKCEILQAKVLLAENILLVLTFQDSPRILFVTGID